MEGSPLHDWDACMHACILPGSLGEGLLCKIRLHYSELTISFDYRCHGYARILANINSTFWLVGVTKK